MGNLIIINNIKQESIARRWSYEKLVSPEDIFDAILSGIDNIYDLAKSKYYRRFFNSIYKTL